MPTELDRVDPKLLELARQVSTATLTSQLQKRGFANTFMYGVSALRPDLRLAGQAFTLRYIPAREDLDPVETDNRTSKQRIAVESVGPGDVLSDAGGSGRHSMARSVIDASGQPAEVSCTTVALLPGVLSLIAGSALATDA